MIMRFGSFVMSPALPSEDAQLRVRPAACTQIANPASGAEFSLFPSRNQGYNPTRDPPAIAETMIQSSFVLLKGIGASTERRLWDIGIRDWALFLEAPVLPGISLQRKGLYDAVLREAGAHIQRRQSRYFTKLLKPRDHWRLFETFQAGALYVDIETTGAPPEHGEITVVGLYRQGQMISLVRGESLTEERLHEEFDRADLLVTFFGSVFDLPYLHAKFPNVRLSHPHFDLCFAARRLGLEGGLKRIESSLGIERPNDLQGLDGWEAVRLWQAWCHGKPAALQRLLRYNEADTKNLEPLARHVFRTLADRYGPLPSQDRRRPAPMHSHAG